MQPCTMMACAAVTDIRSAVSPDVHVTLQVLEEQSLVCSIFQLNAAKHDSTTETCH